MRYHEYVAADSAFKGFENHCKDQEKAAEGIKLTAGEYKYSDMTVAEKAFGKRKDLINAWTRANRRYSRPFRK
jgi:hypothetical protein